MQNYYFSMKLKHMFLFFNDLKMKRMVIHPIYSVAIINAPIVITNMKRMNDIVFLETKEWQHVSHYINNAAGFVSMIFQMIEKIEPAAELPCYCGQFGGAEIRGVGRTKSFRPWMLLEEQEIA
jgi:hypothetical protein